MEKKNAAIIVRGKLTDDQTRCIHYHSPVDVIAIKLKCCGEYYACFYCHEEEADHQTKQWKMEEYGTKAILCGICQHEMTISEYKHCNYHCPHCNAAFNPNCSRHDHLYFSG